MLYVANIVEQTSAWAVGLRQPRGPWRGPGTSIVGQGGDMIYWTSNTNRFAPPRLTARVLSLLPLVIKDNY